ncbi:MAG TPA: RidA family protein [Gemmatimonadaceae bacterium]|nr:RidA family protein [Gemmatimonadaceae bacterium]
MSGVTLDIIHPDAWPPPRGYSNAVAARGRAVYVAGQVGWDPLTGKFESDEMAPQVRRALQNVVEVLRAAGAEPRHLVRLTWFITDKPAYVAARVAIGAIYREIMGRHYPAMSLLVVSALLEDRAKVEIEATAVVP